MRWRPVCGAEIREPVCGAGKRVDAYAMASPSASSASTSESRLVCLDRAEIVGVRRVSSSSSLSTSVNRGRQRGGGYVGFGLVYARVGWWYGKLKWRSLHAGAHSAQTTTHLPSRHRPPSRTADASVLRLRCHHSCQRRFDRRVQHHSEHCARSEVRCDRKKR